MKDIAANIHRVLYKKSDKANSPENQSEDFLAGFEVGKRREINDPIPAEYARRGRPHLGTKECDKFKEWKRGYWASRLQGSVAKFYERNGA